MAFAKLNISKERRGRSNEARREGDREDDAQVKANNSNVKPRKRVSIELMQKKKNRRRTAKANERDEEETLNEG